MIKRNQFYTQGAYISENISPLDELGKNEEKGEKRIQGKGEEKGKKQDGCLENICSWNTDMTSCPSNINKGHMHE